MTSFPSLVSDTVKKPLLLADPQSSTSAPPRERAEEAWVVTEPETQCALALSIALIISVTLFTTRFVLSKKSRSATQTVLQWHTTL